MSIRKIFGLHAVQAALEYSPKKIKKAWIDSHRHDRRLQKMIDQLRALGIEAQKTEKKALEALSNGSSHQGIIIEIEMPRERSEDELKQAVSKLIDPPFFLALDHIQDPHNLGACLRTADAVGIQGIIITKDQAAGITPSVCKVACGAAEKIPVYRVTNLARTLRWLKSENIWIVGAAGEAEQTAYQANLNIPLTLVVGAEEKGLRRLTRENCDILVKIPMVGAVESLNLSVAAGVLLYEIVRQKMSD